MDKKCFIIAECGINHNGNINIAKKMMLASKEAGADAVKFQKRTINKVYTKEELDKPRESPWGTTNRQQKEGLELKENDYDEIDRYSKELKIPWFASCWDLESYRFIRRYNCNYNKIASAMLGHKKLIEEVAKDKKMTFIATGMATMREIFECVIIFKDCECPFMLMHCNSQYPMPDEKANLKMIRTLKHYFDCDVGYSGHEVGIITSVAAVCYGATAIERHITLDRSMYGSDQAASIEPQGFKKMVEYIRIVEKIEGNGIKTITEEEEKIRKKLRRTQDIE